MAFNPGRQRPRRRAGRSRKNTTRRSAFRRWQHRALALQCGHDV